MSTEFVTQPQMTGGLAVFIDRISQGLVMQGHEAVVITFSPVERVLELDRVEVHELAPGQTYMGSRRLLGQRLNLTSMMMDFSLRAYSRLKHLHRQNPIDLVQFTNINGVGLIPSLFLQIPSVTCMASFRPLMNELRGYTSRDYRILEKVEEIQLRRSKFIFCASHYLQRVVKKNLGLEIEVIPNPPFILDNNNLDESVFRTLLQREKYLLFFSKMLQTLKGTFVLAEALPRVLEAYPELKAVIIGGDMPAGSEHASLSARQRFESICRKELSHLIFLDPLPHAKLYPIIANARLVILPSLSENLSNACMEAMGLGRPVVGTRGISFDELIDDGISGFLSEPGQADDLSRVILEALSRDDLEQVGLAAQRRMAEFSPESVMPKLIDYYQQAITAN